MVRKLAKCNGRVETAGFSGGRASETVIPSRFAVCSRTVVAVVCFKTASEAVTGPRAGVNDVVAVCRAVGSSPS